MLLAHLSDIHICNNRANMARLFWDFLLASGIPAALLPLVRPILASTRSQRQVFRWLTRRPGAVLNPAALAVAVGVTLPFAIFLVRQFIRFRRIFYIRQDRPGLREALVRDVWRIGANHTVITGDLVNTADVREFEAVADLVDELGGRARVTVVPGNHDVDIQNRRMRRPAHVPREEKLHLYLEGMFVPKTFPKGIPGPKAHRFPFVRFLRPGICLICLDSTTYNPVANTNGRVDDAQLERLEAILAASAVRDRMKIVALHHHVTDAPRGRKFRAEPLDRIAGRVDALMMKRLANAEALLEILCGGRVDQVIHGHRHTPYATDAGGARILCAGSAAHADLSGKFPPSYNLIRIEGGSVEAFRRVWTGEGWEDGDIPEGPRDES